MSRSRELRRRGSPAERLPLPETTVIPSSNDTGLTASLRLTDQHLFDSVAEFNVR